MPRIGFAVVAVAFAVLCAAAAPGLYLRDSGELTTAAFSLGIAHETGFPLWCLLGKAFALLPLGEIAFRLSLLSAAAGAATCWLVYRLVRELPPRPGATAEVAGAAAAGLALAGLTLFKASTVAEVYAPTAAALALGLYLFQRARAGSTKAALGLALLGGLTLGLHAQARLLLGPPVIVWALVRLRRGDRWPLVAPAAVAVGAAVVAYLPLRAARHPAANWADPETLTGLWHHLAAFRIRRAFAGEMLRTDGPSLRHHLALYAGQLEGQLGVLALLAAAGGLVALLAARRTRAFGILLALLGAGDLVYSVLVNPMGLPDLQCGTPGALVIAIAAGAALALGLPRLSSGAAPYLAGALGVLLCVPAALDGLDAKRGLGPEAGSWTRAALAQAEPRALVLTTSDDLSAGLLYEQHVAGARPDVTALVRQQLWDASLVAARVRHAGGELGAEPERLRWSQRSEPERIRGEPALLAALVHKEPARRQVLWEPGSDGPPVPREQLEPGVPLYRLAPAGPPLALPPARPLAARVEELLLPSRDPLVVRLAASTLSGLGRSYLERADPVRAAALFEAALALRPGDPVAATNLAVVRAQRGDVAGAAALVREVLEREPTRLVARLNSGRYRLQLGDLDGAERELRAARALAPEEPGPLVGLARLAERRGQPKEARRLCAQALALRPDDPEARALCDELR